MTSSGENAGRLKILCIPAAHHALYTRGFSNLNENGREINGNDVVEVCFDKIRVNHYFCKSVEEYTSIKMGRGDVTFGVTVKKMEIFHYLDRNELTDTDILSRI